jgi:purine nucleoside phosphorylase
LQTQRATGFGVMNGKRVVFLARHGLDTPFMPSEVITARIFTRLKSMGVPRIVSISACGSLREDYAPGEIIIPDQYSISPAPDVRIHILGMVWLCM